MIHHISMAAQDPKRVADVFAELMDGRCFPFPGGFRDSWMALAGDARGTAVEVYPAGMRLVPDGADAVRPDETARESGPEGFVSFHMLLSVPLDRAAIEAIGKREGWLTRFCGRGAPGQKPLFHLIEFWVENRVMIELAPLDLIGEYEQSVTIERLDAMAAMMRQTVGA